MLSQGQELAAIDFADIIGGPLLAVINAQAKAANMTYAFIQQVGFTGSGSTPQLKVVEFDFSQMLGGNTGMSGGSSTIKVPLLSLIPIPFIRIESMTITFNVSLSATTSTSISNNFVFSANSSTSDSAGGGFAGFDMNSQTSFSASVTDNNTYQNGQVIDDTYSLNVVVNAVQDQMPGGMAQILGIFGNLIQSQSTLLQTVMTQEIQAQQAQMQSRLPSSTPASA